MDEPRTAAAVWLGVAIERAVADLRRDGAHTTADDLKRAWAARAEVAEPGDASEYGRLLAERDRLVSQGVDPADLLVPDAPLTRAATTAREPLDALREALASAHRPHRPSCPKDRHPGSHMEPPDPCECGVDDLLALDTPDPGAS